MNKLKRTMSNSHIELYERYLCIDLLTRGKGLMHTQDYTELKIALATNNIESIRNTLSLYELKAKGLDTRENLNSLLRHLGLVIEGNRGSNYRVSPSVPLNFIQHTSLIREYRHLSDIGNSLRELESQPGALGLEFISLYSWGKRLNQTITTPFTNKVEGISKPPSMTLLNHTKRDRGSKREVVLM